MQFFKKQENNPQNEGAKAALKRYQAALSIFNQAQDDAAVDYAIFELEAAHREYALLSAAARAAEKAPGSADVQAEHTVV